MTIDEARDYALSLPEVVEAPHFTWGSFRVGGRIIATVPPDGEHLHVFVDEGETRAAVAEDSSAFEELWWGKKLLGVRVNLPRAGSDRVRELLDEAWRRRAPKRLLSTR
ncbi:MAG: MmcQ/YjbR family DNA-binding protein [Armatimonadota bacterium]